MKRFLVALGLTLSLVGVPFASAAATESPVAAEVAAVSVADQQNQQNQQQDEGGGGWGLWGLTGLLGLLGLLGMRKQKEPHGSSAAGGRGMQR